MATGRLPDPNTAPLTAKGDLYTYSTVPARLAVGSNGDTLVADSSQTTGLRYNPPVGSLANPVINGGMDIWQRGTSFANPANGYTADRWLGASNAGLTVSRQTVSDSTNLPNIQYALRVQRNNGSSTTNELAVSQSFETVNSIPFAGKVVTLSFYARAGANYSPTSTRINARINTGTGTDQNVWTAGYTGSAEPVTGQPTLTTTWQRFALTGTIASTTTEIGITFGMTPTGTAGANDWFEVTGVQVDVGTWTASTAPTFRRSGGTLAGELAACQRYYYRNTPNQTYGNYALGMATSTTATQYLINLPVQMRTAPASVDYANIITSLPGTADYAFTGLTITGVYTGSNVVIINTTGHTGLTQNRFYFLQNNNNTAGYLGFSAEL